MIRCAVASDEPEIRECASLNAVHLYTNEKMAENLLIYPKLGYTEVERRTEDGFNRVYFEKTLDLAATQGHFKTETLFVSNN